jgi:hypothetical protein
MWRLAWGLIITAALLTELMGIILNDKYDSLEKPRRYRTLTENVRWLFATDKEGARARYRGLRRFALLAGMAGLAVHFAVENWV